MLVYDGLEQWLRENNMSIAELGRLTGKRTGYWSEVLGRTKGLSTDMFCKLCEVTGLPVERLVHWYSDRSSDLRKDYRSGDVRFDRLIALFESTKMGRAEFSLAAGLNRDCISGIYAGKKPRIETVRKLAEYLGVKPGDLFEIVEK